MNRKEALQDLAFDVLFWLISPQLCFRNYRALRRFMHPVGDSWTTAANYASFGLDIEPSLSWMFAREMAATWGEDESWLTRYKGD